MSARDVWAGTFHDLVDGRTPLRRDCLETLPAPPPLPAAQLNAEMNIPLNDHHTDSLNLLCYLSQHSHPVCAEYAHDAATTAKQASYQQHLTTQLARLGLAPVYLDAEWRSTNPFLAPAIAGLLRQRHFGAISKAMMDTYRVLAGAA